jgi:predicted  nucleic acid-binding Zn-ribbon protein
LHNLYALQTLELEKKSAAPSQIALLRADIPQALLRNYDRMRAKGKKGIALVRNHVCTNCRIQVPIAVTASLMNGALIQVCGNCGRYLCLPEPAVAEPMEDVAIAAPQPKRRQRRAAFASA